MHAPTATIVPIGPRLRRQSQWNNAVEEWRGEWRAGVAALVGTSLCLSAWPSVTSLFVRPLQDAFGWSRGDIAFAYNASIAVAFAAPLFGRLIDRIGVRSVVLWAMVLTAFGYLGLSAMNDSLPLYYMLYLVTTTVGICTSGLSFTRVVSGAFVKTRGLALAITRSGVSFVGAILPPIMFTVIARAGWRAGFVLLASLILFGALPVVYAFAKRRSISAPVGAKPNPFREWLTLLRNRKVLLLCCAAGLSFAPGVSLLQQLHPLLVGKGLSPSVSASLIGLVGASALAGTVISGLLVDRIWAPIVGCILTLGPAFGCLFLLPEHIELGGAVIATVLLGLCQGAEIDIVAFMVARYFGLKSYASIYGLTVFFIAILNAAYANIVAQSYDRTGSYRIAILICVVTFVGAAACYLMMGRYPVAVSVNRDE